VAKLVARIIAIALDLEADVFEKPEIFGEPIADLRLLHYEGRFYFAKLHNKNPQFFLLILLIFPSLFRCSL